MPISVEFIIQSIQTQNYEISLHADDERIADDLLIDDIEDVLLNCVILEEYPEDRRGESCLVLGFTAKEKPVHVVCGKGVSGKGRQENLTVITVYIPSNPKWMDAYTRNTKDKKDEHL